MKKCYGKRMKGSFKIERVTSLPVWSGAQGSRVLYDNSTKKLCFSSASEWRKLEEEPVGKIEMFAGPIINIPQGYLNCNGTAVSRTTYSRLFAKIGTIWGPGDGVNTFNLPNLGQRFSRGQGGGLSVGQNGGVETIGNLHTHTISSDPSHAHSLTAAPDHNHTASGNTELNTTSSTDNRGGSSHLQHDANHTHPFSIVTSSTGNHNHTISPAGSHSHGGLTGSGGNASQDIMPSYAVVNFIIKY